MSTESQHTTPSIDQLVNWDLLKDPEVVEQCHKDLQQGGVMVLPGFASSDGLCQLLAEIEEAPFNESQQHYTAWQDPGDDSYSTSHPRNYRFRSSSAFVGRKTLEKTSQKLGVSLYYHEDLLLNFLSQVANHQLWRSQDDNGSVYSHRIHSNHQPSWHFDEAPYTAILYLQASEEGGEFEYVPWSRPTRSKEDSKGHEIVDEILIRGNRSKVKQVAPKPGSLLFFGGAHSFHRAAPITGSVTPRIGLVFTFADSEGFANSNFVKNARMASRRMNESSC